MLLLVFAALTMGVATDSISTRTLSETSIEATAAVVRTCTTTATPQQSLHSEALQSLGITEVGEALKLMNGISVKDYGGLGGMKTVSIRNLGATHTGVLYDGIPVSNAQAGQIDVARFGSQQLSEIRLGIGTSSDLLTPAAVDCYSGLISLSSQGSNQFYASYGSWNTLNVMASCKWKNGLSAHTNYRHTDGNYPFTLNNGDKKLNERRHNGRVDDLNTELNYNKGYWQIKGAGYFNDRRLPGSVVLYNYETHEHMREANGLLQAKYQREFSRHWTLVGRIKYNHAMTHYNDGLQQPSGTASVQHVYNYRQNEYYGSAGAMKSIKSGQFQARFSLLYDVLLASLHSNLNTAHSIQRTTHYGVFRTDVSYWKYQIQGGLLYTISSEENRTHSAWSPTIAASVPLWSNPNHDLRLRWMSRMAFRLPTFNETYYYVLGNHNLNPEKAREHNVGLTYSGSLRQIRVSATADVYHYRVEDKLIAFPTAFAWKVGNLGEAVSQGIEVSTHILFPVPHCPVELSANYQLQDTRNLDNPQNPNTYRKALPYVPRQTANGMLILRTPWLNVGYSAQWTSERYSSTMNTFRYRLEPFCEQSISVSRNWKWLELQATVQNLTDEQYSLIQYYPMPGRLYRICVRIRY